MSAQRIVLSHLSELVAHDTQNPPRAFDSRSPIWGYVSQVLSLAGFEVQLTDHGAGHVNLFALRGQTDVLFNCHLDTVPASSSWQRPPLTLSVEDERAYGLGATDIKGAAAALLTVAETTDQPMALLLSSDEEGAGSCCIRHFLNSPAARAFSHAVVAEPTGCRAVLAHNGYLSVKGWFKGVAGHSSELRALTDNANHRLAHWMVRAIAHCQALADADRPTRFNVGLLSGGIKSNVIADEAHVHYSARLSPGESNDELFAALSALVETKNDARWEVPFSGSPLPAAGQNHQAAWRFCQRHGLDMGEPVGFWTEAALFSEAGLSAIVLGPGDIAQAHTADEWVEVEQLTQITACYRRIVEG